MVARDLPVLREVFGESVSYAADVPQLADALAGALGTDTDRSTAGRDLAESMTWAAAAQAHLRFYADHPMPTN